MDKNFKKNFLKGSLFTSIGQLASIALFFLNTIIIARTIIKEEFGTFSLILAIIAFLQLIGGLGLNVTLTKYLSANQDSIQTSKLQDLISLRMLSLGLISILFYIINKLFVLFDPEINIYAIQIILIFFLNSLRDFYYAELQGLRKFKEFAIVQFVSALIKTISYVVGLYLKIINLEFLIYAELGSIIFSFFFQQFLVPIHFKINFNLKIKTIKEIIKFSYPLYFNNLLALVNSRANAFIISGFKGPVSLAHYEIAGKIPDALNRIYNSFILVFFPNVAYLVNENKESEAHNFINKSILNINLLIIPILITTYIFQREIIVTLFSTNYEESAFALFLFIITFYFRSIGSITGYSLVAINKNILSFNANFIGVTVGVIFSIILTPIFGFNGAIYGIIFSRVISSSLGIFYLNKYFYKISYMNSIIPLIYCIPFIVAYEFLGIDKIIYKIVIILILFNNFFNIFDFRNNLI